MLKLARRKRIDGPELPSTVAPPKAPLFIDSAEGFVSIVMSLNYRPKVALQNMVRAEREFIGRGQSFIVEKGIIQETGTQSQAVVVKRPFFSDSERNDDQHWNGLVLEVLALMHPPISAHRNVVDLLAIGWEAGNSDASPETEWPALVMPFATYGTLDIYQKENDIPEPKILGICLDVARGLEVLHRCGIVHGDLKSENVLIFHDDSDPVAKLCDFGCSIAGGQDVMKLRGGSQPWNCPEWKTEMRREALPLTDVYSFGLLFWRSLSKAGNPFQKLRSFSELHSLNLRDIERLKEMRDDQLLEEITESLELSSSNPSMRAKLMQSILQHTVRFEPQRRNLGQCLENLGKLAPQSLEIKSGIVSHDNEKLEPLFLQQQASFDPQSARNLSWLHQVEIFEHHRRTLNPLVKGATSEQEVESSMWLFFCYLLGVGTSADMSLACKYLHNASLAGGPVARAFLGRAITTLKPLTTPSLDLHTLQVWLLRGIETGCVGAREDFQRIIMPPLDKEPELAVIKRNYAKACDMLRNHYAGIGATHFVDSRGYRLKILSIDDGDQFEREIAQKSEERGFDINAFTINSRGDRLLHFAAACGFIKAVVFLLDHFKGSLDISTTNDDGETALISACRAGQAESVRILLHNGADLRPSNFGESPLHWLPALDPEFIPELAVLMLESGLSASSLDEADYKKQVLHQKAQKMKWTQFWDSEYPAGTPLHRAVHFNNLIAVNTLLEMGCDPEEPSSDCHGEVDSDEVSPSSLQLACISHYASIVEAMLTKMKISDVNCVAGPALLHVALSRRDKLASLSLVGSDMLSDFYKTVLLLMRRGANPGIVCCEMTDSHTTCTALFEAVKSRSMDCVTVALQPGLLTSPELLNTRCGEEELTPLGLAVEMGLFEVVAALLKQGADPKVTYGKGFRSVLHSCANMASSSPHTLEIFDLLVPYFDNVDQSTDGYETPFIQAVRLLKFHLAQKFLDKGASINFEFSNGDTDIIIKEPMTILGLLLQQKNSGAIAAVRFLLGFDSKGIKKKNWRHPLPSVFQSKDHGTTVFHAIAFRRPSPLYPVGVIREMISYVIEAFGESMINQQATLSPKPTALHIAAVTSNIEVVVALLNHGAKRDIVDDDELRPVDYACHRLLEDVPIDVEIGWTEAAAKKEQDRRLEIYQLLGGDMDIFEAQP